MIALYKGRSLISRIIRCVNWSDYSHAAWVDTVNNYVIEAWSGGVRKADSLHTNHTPGTIVDVFDVDVTVAQREAIAQFMLLQVGKRYDYRGIVHFITRRSESAAGQDRWFCSELVLAAYRAAGIDLLSRIPAYKVFPGMLAYSPLLDPVGTITTRAESKLADRNIDGAVGSPSAVSASQISAFQPLPLKGQEGPFLPSQLSPPPSTAKSRPVKMQWVSAKLHSICAAWPVKMQWVSAKLHSICAAWCPCGRYA
jgi:hypothetical protein